MLEDGLEVSIGSNHSGGTRFGSQLPQALCANFTTIALATNSLLLGKVQGAGEHKAK